MAVNKDQKHAPCRAMSGWLTPCARPLGHTGDHQDSQRGIFSTAVIQAVDPKSPGAVPKPIAEDAYSFIQLADFIAVIDARKQELYSDKRVRLGAPICRDGDVVTSITLANGWFDVVTASRTYRIPVTNVRSAVR